MSRNVVWQPSESDIHTLHRTVGRRLKQAMPTIPPARIDDQIEEIVQSGFLQYMEVIQDPKAERIDKPAHWVANASLNKGMNAMRDSGVRRTRESPTDAEGMEVVAQVTNTVEGRTTGAINPIEKVLSAEAMATLFAAIRSLTDRQLEVFVKVDIDGERQTDVAKELKTRIGSVEKVLDAARARVWWIVAKSHYDGLCPDFYDLIPGLDLTDRPNKKQTTIIAKHVRSCEMCKASITDTSPLAIDIGLLAGAGILGGGTTATFAERIVESPIIAKPLSVLDSIGNSVKSGVDKITPGGSHATEAAAGGATTGAGVAGVGGGALVIGGGKIAAICAGGAVTACLAGVATGVVPLPDGKADSTKDKTVVEREADSAGSPASVMTSSEAVDPRVVSRQVNTAKREAQAKREKVAAQKKAAQEKAEQKAEKEAAAVAAAEPTTQAATNESSADQSFSFSGGSSSGGSTSSAPSSSSSSSSSGSSGGTSAPTPQQQTNQSTANASMGCC